MSRYIKTLLIAGLFLTGLNFAPSLPAYAYDPLEDVCTGAYDSETCNTADGTDASKNPLTGKDGLLFKISTTVAIIAGIVAVIMIMVSGFQMITSGGDPQKATNARKILTGSLVGLVIIALAQSIIMFVVGRL